MKMKLKKTTYYQHNKIPSIEFDLSAYLNRNIDEALSDLKAKKSALQMALRMVPRTTH